MPSGSRKPGGEWKEADRHVRPRKTPTGLEGLRERIGALFGPATPFHSPDYDLVRCRRAWPEIAGPLGAFSYPDRFRGEDRSILEVLVENSVHSQELSLYSAEILNRLKSFGLRVDRLYIKSGRIPWDRIAREAARSGGRRGRASGVSPAETPPENAGLGALLEGLISRTRRK